MGPYTEPASPSRVSTTRSTDKAFASLHCRDSSYLAEKAKPQRVFIFSIWKVRHQTFAIASKCIRLFVIASSLLQKPLPWWAGHLTECKIKCSTSVDGFFTHVALLSNCSNMRITFDVHSLWQVMTLHVYAWTWKYMRCRCDVIRLIVSPWDTFTWHCPWSSVLCCAGDTPILPEKDDSCLYLVDFHFPGINTPLWHHHATPCHARSLNVSIFIVNKELDLGICCSCKDLIIREHLLAATRMWRSFTTQRLIPWVAPQLRLKPLYLSFTAFSTPFHCCLAGAFSRKAHRSSASAACSLGKHGKIYEANPSDKQQPKKSMALQAPCFSQRHTVCACVCGTVQALGFKDGLILHTCECGGLNHVAVMGTGGPIFSTKNRVSLLEIWQKRWLEKVEKRTRQTVVQECRVCYTEWTERQQKHTQESVPQSVHMHSDFFSSS